MSIRTPNLAPPEEIPEGTNITYLLHCELVTPMYGGGVKAATIDKQMPIRASSIRGQLRFWWRLLAQNKWKLGDNKTVRNAELALWGGMADGDNGTASQVTVKVQQPSTQAIRLIDWKSINLPYVMFPASNETDSSITHDLLNHEGVSFNLEFSFIPQITAEQKQQALETIRWWVNFGGFGARTRRGLGAFGVNECAHNPDLIKPLTPKEVAEAGCDLRISSAGKINALEQLQKTIEKYQKFRQGAGVGRNPGQKPNRPGRSRWPEPDAIRRITRTHAALHKPEHVAGNVFPRAVFGMPILFHIRGEIEGNNQISPINAERYPSPLITRPYNTGKLQEGKILWAQAVLALPYKHLLTMQVALDGDGKHPIWQNDTAQNTQPIRDFGLDPIDAFLNYFGK